VLLAPSDGSDVGSGLCSSVESDVYCKTYSSGGRRILGVGIDPDVSGALAVLWARTAQQGDWCQLPLTSADSVAGQEPGAAASRAETAAVAVTETAINATASATADPATARETPAAAAAAVDRGVLPGSPLRGDCIEAALGTPPEADALTPPEADGLPPSEDASVTRRGLDGDGSPVHDLLGVQVRVESVHCCGLSSLLQARHCNSVLRRSGICAWPLALDTSWVSPSAFFRSLLSRADLGSVSCASLGPCCSRADLRRPL